MASIETVLIESKTLEGVQTDQYTAIGVRTRIHKFTLTNQDAVARAVSVNLIPSGGSAAASNLIVKARNILPGQTYECHELVGQLLASGGKISTIAPAGSSVTCRASGVEIA